MRGHVHLIISKTPYRISFFGGGTDYPAWYLKEEGAVLSTTIDKYCHISCRYLPPFFVNCKHRIVWSHIETVPSLSEILHPAVREGLRFLGYDDSVGLEIHHQGDLPARSGIGSSSSFAVGLINALTVLNSISSEFSGRTLPFGKIGPRIFDVVPHGRYGAHPSDHNSLSRVFSCHHKLSSPSKHTVR